MQIYVSVLLVPFGLYWVGYFIARFGIQTSRNRLYDTAAILILYWIMPISLSPSIPYTTYPIGFFFGVISASTIGYPGYPMLQLAALVMSTVFCSITILMTIDVLRQARSYFRPPMPSSQLESPIQDVSGRDQ